MADEQGKPVELTDKEGNPVELTDKEGNPVELIVVDTAKTTGVGVHDGLTGEEDVHAGEPTATGDVNQMGVLGTAAGTGALREGEHKDLKHELEEEHKREGEGEAEAKAEREIHRSSSSSSSSSEDDGQGGRRKKKGLKEKIREKLTGRKHKDEHPETTIVSETVTTTTTGQHHEHEKKSMMEKIKEKLPGGHHSH